MSLFAGNNSRPNSGRGGDSPSEPRESGNLGDTSSTLSSRANVFSRAAPDAENKPRPAQNEGDAGAAALPTLNSPTPPERCANVLAAGARWQGNLHVEDSVRIDGNFSGEVHSKGTVHISEGAKVEARVRAQFVVVQGTVKGEIRCEQRVELQPNSRVSGDLITKLLSVAEGALLDSTVQMGANAQSEDSGPAVKGSKGEARSNQAQQRSEQAAERDAETVSAPGAN